VRVLPLTVASQGVELAAVHILSLAITRKGVEFSAVCILLLLLQRGRRRARGEVGRDHAHGEEAITSMMVSVNMANNRIPSGPR
jgi:hypothetical protein